jgi:hypothetical protein
VQFGGKPNFKSQGVHGPGKYTGSRVIQSVHLRGGKFSTAKAYQPKAEGPTSTQYFGLGRSELNDKGQMWDR